MEQISNPHRLGDILQALKLIEVQSWHSSTLAATRATRKEQQLGAAGIRRVREVAPRGTARASERGRSIHWDICTSYLITITSTIALHFLK